MKRFLFVLTAAVLGLSVGATGVRMRHDIVLKGGWNAIYLPVTPDLSPDELFADWPTDKVACYDPESYLRTAQFETSADDSTLGAVSPHLRLWLRGEPGRTTLKAVLGDAVYLVNNTNAAPFTATVYGEPRAMRTVWHATVDGTVPVNYLGVSTDGAEAELTADAYLAGLDTEWSGCWTVGGRGTLTQPNLTKTGRTATAANGTAVALDALKAGDWSGPLRVSPALGFDLGTNGTIGVLKVRNDSGLRRTVRVSFAAGAMVAGRPAPTVPSLKYLDPVRNAEWQTESLILSPYERELVAGETLELRLAVDREKDLVGAAGTEYGGIVTVTDVSPVNGSHFQTSVPFSATSDGGAFLRTKWPKGLWVTDVTLDKVAQILPEDRRYEVEVVSTNTYWSVDDDDPSVSNLVTQVSTNMVEIFASEPVPTPAAMKLRLLVHVDYDGAMTLMQRVRLGGRRITAAVLPTDRPLVFGQGTFGATATFRWSVAETSRVNPFYHARHPDHDGLRADFETPAPSGSDFSSYNSSVKPELFAVANTLSLEWSGKTGTAWNPEESLSGTCTWALDGLRREGTLETSGTFTMKRISTSDVNELKEDF